MKNYQIGIIGAGNVAWNLAHSLEDAGHIIVAVYSKTSENAQSLADGLYDCTAMEAPDFGEVDLDFLIVSVPDDAVYSVCETLTVKESTIVVHTSASQDISVLKWASAKYGVFYPLQTFTKGKLISLSTVPICIEASDDEVKSGLISLASSVSSQVYELNGYQRRIAHIGAVFACNFTNYLYALAGTVIESEGMSFDFYHSLIIETAHKAITLGPEAAQTGPAKRHDMATLKIHMDLIKGNPELSALYKVLSEGIMALNPTPPIQTKPKDDIYLL